MPYPTTFPKPVEVYRSSPLRIRLRVWKRLPGTLSVEDAGVPRDLIADFGSTWACHIRPGENSGRVVVCDVDPSGAATGVLVISATGEQTATLDTGDDYGMDIRATNDGGENTFIGKAEVKVDGAFTRD